MYTVLFWIFFTINIGGIGAGFVYFYWYLKKKMLYMLTLILTKKQQFTKYKWGKLDKLMLKIELIIFTTTKLI